MVSLRTLNLDNNDLVTIANVAGPGESLNMLSLNQNQFIEMPTLGSLGKQLTFLSLNCNLNMKAKRNALKGVHHLHTLQLVHCELAVLPSLTHLTGILDTLKIKNIAVTPLDMVMIGKFPMVEMSDPMLRNIPASVCNVTVGYTLDITGVAGFDVCACEMSWLERAPLDGLNVLHGEIIGSGIPWTNLTMEKFLALCQWSPTDDTVDMPYGMTLLRNFSIQKTKRNLNHIVTS